VFRIAPTKGEDARRCRYFRLYCLRHRDTPFSSIGEIALNRKKIGEGRTNIKIFCGCCGDLFRKMDALAQHMNAEGFHVRKSKIVGYNREKFDLSGYLVEHPLSDFLAEAAVTVPAATSEASQPQATPAGAVPSSVLRGGGAKLYRLQACCLVDAISAAVNPLLASFTTSSVAGLPAPLPLQILLFLLHPCQSVQYSPSRIRFLPRLMFLAQLLPRSLEIPPMTFFLHPISAFQVLPRFRRHLRPLYQLQSSTCQTTARLSTHFQLPDHQEFLFKYQSPRFLLRLFRSKLQISNHCWQSLIQTPLKLTYSRPFLSSRRSTICFPKITLCPSALCRRPFLFSSWCMPCGGHQVYYGACLQIIPYPPPSYLLIKLGVPSLWRHLCGLEPNLVLIPIYPRCWQPSSLCIPSCSPVAHIIIRWSISRIGRLPHHLNSSLEPDRYFVARL